MKSKLYQTYHKRFYFWSKMAEKVKNRYELAKAKGETRNAMKAFRIFAYCSMRAKLTEAFMEKAVILEKAIEEHYEH